MITKKVDNIRGTYYEVPIQDMQKLIDIEILEEHMNNNLEINISEFSKYKIALRSTKKVFVEMAYMSGYIVIAAIITFMMALMLAFFKAYHINFIS